MSAKPDSCYIPRCGNSGNADITRIAKDCPVNSLGRAKNKTDTDFGVRLRQAFEGASDSDIGRKLGKTPPDVGKWMKTDNLPLPYILLEIKRVTKCNLHWLLTGEGEASGDPYRFIEENTRAIVRKLADAQEKTFDEVLNKMLRESVAARASALFARYPELETEEFEQMRVLMSLFESDGATSSAVSREEDAG